jgi:membrane protease YdiL (CAAX protease family)
MSDRVKYLLIAFVWTYFFWIGAIVIAFFTHYDLDTSLITSQLLSLIGSGREGIYIDILFALGVFGPAIGYLFVSKNIKVKSKFELKNFLKWILVAIAIPFLMNVIPLVLTWGKSSLEFNQLNMGFITTSVLTYLFFNFLTSGTEELGWRGFLFNDFAKSEKSFWDISWKTGLIWAIWHYPLMFYMYRDMNIAAILSLIFGFTMTIIGMAYISNWLYYKSQSKVILMFFHALNNAWPYLFLIVFGANPFQLLSLALVWGGVFLIEKFDKSLSSFDKQVAQDLK